MRNLSENFGLCPPLVETTSHGSRVTNHQYRSLVYLLVMGVFLTSASTPRSWGRYSGGTGEPNDPYRIATPQDLNDIGNHPEDFNKCFLMVANINLANYTGTQFNIIAPDTDNGQPLFQGTPFTGTFDGNGHIVSNFTYTSTGTDYIALFGYVASPGEIKNLGMVDVNVDAGTGYYVGGLVGLNDYGIVSNCYATGSVSGSSIVGGLVGYDYFGTVTASFWDIDTSGQAISAGGTGKTTVQMQTQSTFTDAGWDFVEIWGIGENQTYPYLRVYPAGDLNHDSRVDFLDFVIFANHWLAGVE